MRFAIPKTFSDFVLAPTAVLAGHDDTLRVK